MKNKHLRSIIMLGSLVLGCLMAVQVYWFRKAFDVEERQFDHSVQIALKKVADSVSRNAEVKKLSSNFFFVSTNANLNDTAIEGLLKNEFILRSLQLDYELGIYNADDDTLVYGTYVAAAKKSLLDDQVSQIVGGASAKNFAVFFPEKKSYVAAQLDVWIFSTIILLLMMGFFSYAIVSLLRERNFSDLRTDFINNMTHEFKTPVTNIQIAGEILRNKIKDESAKAYIEILLKENNKLHQKIDHVLLGSSLEFLKKPSFETMDVHQLVTDCADTFHLKIQQRNGKIDLEFNAKSPFILGDKDLLTHAINNVIDNAEKYSPGNPNIRVVTRDHNNGIQIEISDEGVGIPPKLKFRVFEKFFRVGSGDIHNVKGFGLGLNFVKEVIKSHRGEVSLLSELNKGTLVKIVLPRV